MIKHVLDHITFHPFHDVYVCQNPFHNVYVCRECACVPVCLGHSAFKYNQSPKPEQNACHWWNSIKLMCVSVQIFSELLKIMKNVGPIRVFSQAGDRASHT